MFILTFRPGLGWNTSSTVNDSWEVASVDGKIQKIFPTKEDALAFLKASFGNNVQYIEQEATAQRWAD